MRGAWPRMLRKACWCGQSAAAGRLLHGGENQGHQGRRGKPDPDHPPRAAKPVDLGQHVPEDIAEREQDRPAVEGERAEHEDLGGGDVRDQEHRHEGGQDQVVGLPGRGRPGGGACPVHGGALCHSNQCDTDG